MKRRRVKESADGLALMTSSVTSSYSADGLREQSQKSAVARTSWKHMFNTSWTTRRKQQEHPVESLYEPAVAMNTVASFAYPVASSTHPVVGKSSRELQCYCISSRLGTQTQEKKKQAKCRNSTSRELQIQAQRYSVVVINQQRSS
ncbi:hypothetical protein F511_15700 [Dorcoceras hygrometricum]|uniref:Uncharacterized protein n=1 Tax=Dorcoceras hygrometricum TaxID=472368 RepID=A0A2Z7BDL1_9LAMI|nr:hypothetical protein F511_15700 [Dorcoceras hygrometricum]